MTYLLENSLSVVAVYHLLLLLLSLFVYYRGFKVHVVFPVPKEVKESLETRYQYLLLIIKNKKKS